MAPEGAKKVGVAGIADKGMIILTLTVTMDGINFTISSNL